MTGLLIGEIAERTGVSATTIRYYESIGLLLPALRSSTGYRRYALSTVEELQFIRKAQSFGFALGEISEILTLSRAGEAPCSHVMELARRHLRAVEERIAKLRKFRDEFASQIRKWDEDSIPTRRGLCQIITTAEITADDRSSLQTPRTAARKRKHDH